MNADNGFGDNGFSSYPQNSLPLLEKKKDVKIESTMLSQNM